MALELNNQILTLKGEQKQESGSMGHYHVHEISSGGFVRRFKLPSFVDQDKTSATVAFPKREKAKPRRILIDGQ